MLITRGQMATAILTKANFPITQTSLDFLIAWAAAEHGTVQGAIFNMLDTEEGGQPGETTYNSVGVKDYLTLQSGVTATVTVMHNGYYPHIVSSLQSGKVTAATMASLHTLSIWGTGQFPYLIHTVRQTRSKYYNVPVGTTTVITTVTVTTIVESGTTMAVGTGIITEVGIAKNGHKIMFSVPIATREKWTKYSVIDLGDVAVNQKVLTTAGFSS